MTSAIATNFQSTAEYNAWYDMTKETLITQIYNIINTLMGEWEETNHRSGAFQDAKKWLDTTDEDDWGITAETIMDRFAKRYAEMYENEPDYDISSGYFIGEGALDYDLAELIEEFTACSVFTIMKTATKFPHSVWKKYMDDRF